MKFRDILKGSEIQYSRFIVIENKVKESYLRNLGKNDAIHSRNIELIIDRLVPDTAKCDELIFDHGEIFLLLVSVYLHDIGRIENNCGHELESSRIIRQDFERFNLDRFEGEAIAQICAAHASESVYPIANCDASFSYPAISSSNRDLDIQKLAAILRLADELDNLSTRVTGISGQENSPRNAIHGVSPKNDLGVIEIQSIPEDYEQFISLQRIIAYTQQRLREIQSYLAKAKLHYFEVKLKPDYYPPQVNLDLEKQLTFGFDGLLFSVLSDEFSQVQQGVQIEDVQLSFLCVDDKFGITITVAYLVVEQLKYQYIHALMTLKSNCRINGGVIITLRQPDAFLAEECVKSGIKVVESRKYIFARLGFYAACDRLVQYRKDFLPEKLIPIYAAYGRNKRLPIEKLLRKWCISDSPTLLTMLGGRGAGKTTSCKLFEYYLASQAQNDIFGRFPLYTNLRALKPSMPIEVFLLEQLMAVYDIHISMNVFQNLNKNGFFLIFIDGLDEIDPLASIENVFTSINNIARNKAKILLVSRTDFFAEHKHEADRLENSIIVRLQGLTDQQIKDYIMQYSDVLGFIPSASVLSNFVSVTPLVLRFLEMVISKYDYKDTSQVEQQKMIFSTTNNYLTSDQQSLPNLITPTTLFEASDE